MDSMYKVLGSIFSKKNLSLSEFHTETSMTGMLLRMFMWGGLINTAENKTAGVRQVNDRRTTLVTWETQRHTVDGDRGSSA